MGIEHVCQASRCVRVGRRFEVGGCVECGDEHGGLKGVMELKEKKALQQAHQAADPPCAKRTLD